MSSERQKFSIKPAKSGRYSQSRGSFQVAIDIDGGQSSDLKLIVVPGEAGAIFRVTVAEDDPGILIRKEGRIARSLSIILMAIGMKTKQKINLDIIGPSKLK